MFAHPQVLWLLALLPIAALVSARSSRSSSGSRRAIVAVTRLVCLATAIVSLARPLLTSMNEGSLTCAVIDVSPSIRDDEVLRAISEVRARGLRTGSTDELRVLAFGGRAEFLDISQLPDRSALTAFRAGLNDPSAGSTESALGTTALADALALAGACASDGRPAEILLYTDGWPTRGDAAGEAKLLADRGTVITPIPLQPQAQTFALIDRVTAPPVAAAGQTVPVTVDVRANRDASARIELTVNHRPLVTSSALTIHPGSQAVPLALPVGQGGLTTIDARLVAIDSATVLDSSCAGLYVGAPLRVLVIDGQADHRTTAALSRLLGPAASAAPVVPSELERDDILRDVDLLVLSNTPAAQVTPVAQRNIEAAVAEGLGLLVTGGADSFGPGGWSDAPLARIFPVRMPQQLERQDPSATAVFIIDTSGSMTGPRISLAKEVVRLSLRRLEPQDKAGIVEFYGSKRWAAPIQSAGNHLDLNRALNRLTAGGGTVIFPAIEEAEFALRNVNTRTRHVIILTDGGVESGPFESLTRKMAEQGMTVSTVLVGPGQHSPFLASIAQWGRGRFYHAPDRFNLPELILHQPQTDSPPPVSEASSPLAIRDPDDVTRGLEIGKAPPLAGFVRTQARPTADVLLESGGFPILSRWNHGRGRVAVLASDLGSTWTADFGRWPGAAVLMSNLVRSVAAVPTEQRLRVQPVARSVGLEVQIDLLDPRVFELSEAIAIDLLPLGSTAPLRHVIVDPIRPGEWNELFRNVPPGTYEVRASSLIRGVSGRGGVAISELRELRSDQPNQALLKLLQDIGRGARVSTARPSARIVELWPVLVIASLAMFLLNILVRRWPLSRPHVHSTNMLSIAAVIVLVNCGLSRAAPATSRISTTQPTTARFQTALEAGDLTIAIQELTAATQASSVDSGNDQLLAMLYQIRADDAAAAQALSRAMEHEPEPVARDRLQAALATLLLDSGKEDDAKKVLTGRAATTQSAASGAILASLYGDEKLAAEAVERGVGEKDVFQLVLQGTCQLRVQRSAAAHTSFAAAVGKAGQARDRRFITDRIVAAARAAGKLSELADEWMAEQQLSADRVLPLIGILRELSRVDDVLALWKRQSSDAAWEQVVTSPRFVNEVVAIARQAGRLADAEAVCRAALQAVQRNDRWLEVVVRILVEQDRLADADALLLEAANPSRSAQGLLSLAQRAKALGRDDVAISLAAMSGQSGTADRVNSLLFQAEVESRRGNREVSFKDLAEAGTVAGQDPKLLVNVAEAYEHAGDTAQALRLYQAAAGPGEDVLQRLAWLLESTGNLAEAQEIWAKLWRSAGSPPRKREAQNRLLDLASRIGTLADLASELEERLSAGKAGSEDLSLLIDIYIGAQDPAAASELLNAYKNLAGSEMAALDSLARLYLKCGRFGQADRALRQLLVADPAHAVDTLQEIAVLAIERNRPLDAETALSEIAARTGSDSATIEARAGVYEQLGLSADAAREYRLALERNPEQIEDWVLWAGAMNAAGMKAQAVQRLLILAAQAEGDDLFAVAVDGLLNLEAERSALRLVRRFAMARVACDPRKLVLYQLIRDISEAMGDLRTALRAGELSLLIAGEQRTELLRELITLCRQAGESARSVEFGQTLLALGDQVPPQVFLDIGKQLLDDGRMGEADRAFARAVEVSGDDEIRRQIARTYESAGQMRLAIDTLHPLMRLHPTDLELRCRVGGMHEQLGEYDEASADFLEGLKLLTSRGSLGIATTSIAAGRMRAAPRQGASLSEADQFLDGLIQGLITCARTPQTQRTLLDWVVTSGRAELKAAGKGDKVPARCVERAALLRRFAFALHEPEVADLFDVEVAAQYPDDATFAQTIIDARLDWGLVDRAAKVAVAVHQPLPSELQLRQALIADSPPEKQPTDPDFVARLAPQLIIDGQIQRAADLLASVQKKLPREPSSIPLLLTCATALGDAASAEAWQGIWIARAEGRRGGGPDPAEIAQVVRLSWPGLSISGRRSLLARVSASAARSDGDDQGAVAFLCLRMAVALDEDAATRLKLAQAAVPAATASGGDLAELLTAVDASSRSELLRSAIEIVPVAKRRGVLLQFLGAAPMRLEAQLLDTFMQLMTSAQPPAVADRREMLSGAWARNSNQIPALRKVTEFLTREVDLDLQSSIAIAQAMATCGEQDAANKLVGEAIGQMVTTTQRARLDGRALGDAVEVLSVPAAKAMLQQQSASSQPAQGNALRPLLRALLLERSGQHAEANDAFRQAFLANPSDMELRRLFTDELESDLRWADMVDAFEPFMNDEGVVNQPQRFRLQKAYRQLGRYREAGAMYKEDGPLRHLQRLQMGAESGSTSDLLGLFRSFHVDNRWERRSFTPYMQPLVGVGGMAEFVSRKENIYGRVSIYRLIASLPWGLDELQALFNAALPDATEVATLSSALAAACEKPEILQRVDAQLSQAAAAGTATLKELSLVAAILQEGHAIEPRTVTTLRRSSRLPEPLDLTSLKGWAENLRSNGQNDRAESLERWISAAASVLGGSKFLQGRAGSVTAAKPSCASMTREQIDAAAPVPGSIVDDATESDRLERLAELEPTAAEVEIAKLRDRGIISRSSYPLITMQWAKLAGERGDVPTFAARAKLAIDAVPVRFAIRAADVRKLLSPRLSDEQAVVLVNALRQVLQQTAQSKPEEAENVCRALCLLGEWCKQRKLAEEAQRCLALAEQVAPEKGEHQLWVADLARLCGVDNRATEIEMLLLNHRMLPPTRFADLFQRVEASQGRKAAQDLAEQASRWSPAASRQPTTSNTFR